MVIERILINSTYRQTPHNTFLIYHLESYFHLNPENYFISFVPVSVNLPMIILADAISYLVIMVLLLIPAMFISKIDPAQTVRAQ